MPSARAGCAQRSPSRPRRTKSLQPTLSAQRFWTACRPRKSRRGWKTSQPLRFQNLQRGQLGGRGASPLPRFHWRKRGNRARSDQTRPPRALEDSSRRDARRWVLEGGWVLEGEWLSPCLYVSSCWSSLCMCMRWPRQVDTRGSMDDEPLLSMLTWRYQAGT